MDVNDTIHLSLVTAPAGVTILTDPESVLATITPPRLQVEAETEIETETEVVGEGEAGAEGEAAGEGESGDSEAGGESGSDSSE
jgi:large subunit ribosomal protein L25